MLGSRRLGSATSQKVITDELPAWLPFVTIIEISISFS